MHSPLLTPLGHDLDLIASTVADDRPVPTCPDWSAHDLLEHVGGVAHFAAGCLRAGDGADAPSRPSAPPGTDPADWVRDGHRALLAAFADLDDDALRPSFVGPRTAQWWARRMAVEMALHRRDAQGVPGTGTAAGPPAPIDRQVAEAGLDEYFDFVLADLMVDRTSSWTTSVHLHATDGDGEWSASWDHGEMTWAHTHDKGELALRASTSDLLCLLWERPTDGEIELFGDQALLGRLRAGH